jgi:hypothetical protein
VPYLRAVSDPYDDISPHHSWSERLPASRIATRLGVPGLRTIVLERNGSGRVGNVVVTWKGGSRTIPGRTFQHALGLQSTWFSIRGPGDGDVHLHRRRRRQTQPQPSRPWIVVAASVPISRPRPSGQVMRSDDHPGLAPGYWVVYRGPYASRAEAQAHAGGGYVRRLAG